MSTAFPRLGAVAVGDALPELAIEVTTTLIVAGALASHDFTPVHHDKSAARRQGLNDVFMNILTTNGLVSRYVTDWAGPDARLTRVSIKLGAPNLPGDTMRLTGVVASKSDDGSLEVEVIGKNSWGNHVTAKVGLVLPSEAA